MRSRANNYEKQIRKLFVQGLLLLFLVSPFVVPSVQAETLRIGLLADSHIQTDKATKRVKWQKGGFEKTIVGSALRAPELNMAVTDLLTSFLEKMKEEKVDIILYLGDGANNGCADELGVKEDIKADKADKFVIDRSKSGKGILSILSKFRDNTKIPIFYIVGNHDYLGAGNTTLSSQRLKLCNDEQPSPPHPQKFNKPILKHNLIEILHTFNKENKDIAKTSKIKKLSYVDNFDDGNVIKLCTDKAYEIEKGELKELPPELEHSKPGCFLAGRVQFDFDENERPYEILLVDTSDYYGYAPADYYKSAPNFEEGLFKFLSDKLAPSLIKTDFWGDLTWISFPDQWRSFAEQNLANRNIHQTSWFKKAKAKAKAKDNREPIFTMVASHYDPNQVFSQLRDVNNVNKLCDIFKNAGSENTDVYWVSAHTHTDIPNYKYYRPISATCEDNNEYGIKSLNIGSTTDFNPQVVVVSIDENKIRPENVKIFQFSDKDRNVNSRKCNKTDEQKEMRCEGKKGQGQRQRQEKENCVNTVVLLKRECCNVIVDKYSSIKEFLDYPEDYVANDYAIGHILAEAAGYVMDDPREYVRFVNYSFDINAYKKGIKKLAEDESLKRDLKTLECDTTDTQTLIKQCLASDASEKDGPRINQECYTSFDFSVGDFVGRPYSAKKLCKNLQNYSSKHNQFVKGLSPRGLCKAISHDIGFKIPKTTKGEDYNKCLNALLKDPALYKKLTDKYKDHYFQPEFIERMEKCDDPEECNLDAIEELYPHETAKSCAIYLNALLKDPDLGKKLVDKHKDHYFRPEFRNLKEDCDNSNLSLERCNRAAIEEFYPDDTPRGRHVWSAE